VEDYLEQKYLLVMIFVVKLSQDAKMEDGIQLNVMNQYLEIKLDLLLLKEHTFQFQALKYTLERKERLKTMMKKQLKPNPLVQCQRLNLKTHL
jgi:hypothetical protein